MAHATRWWWVAAAVGAIALAALAWWSTTRDGSASGPAPSASIATASPVPSRSAATSTAPPAQSAHTTPGGASSRSSASAGPHSSNPAPTATATDPPRPTAPAGSGVADVDVTLASWGYATSEGLSASGVVSGTVEDSGTCTLVATRGQTTRLASGRGHASASTTACAAGLRIPAADLAPGDWQVHIVYRSARARGTSDAETVHVGG